MEEYVNGYRKELDSRVKRLVYIMSFLPGIYTFTSCGGHEVKTHPTQCGQDDFSVCFFVFSKENGFSSLILIARAVQNVGNNNIICAVSGCKESDERLIIVLHGSNGVSPNDLADELEKGIKIRYNVTDISTLPSHFIPAD